MKITKLKICGITDYETLSYCNNNKVDFVGLVFTTSRRKIEVDHALELLSMLKHKHSKIVGVFKNEPEPLIRTIAETCHLDFIQLHGHTKYSESLYTDYNVIRALPFNTPISTLDYSISLSKYLLIDSQTPGSGKSFNWDAVTINTHASKLIIAGGINQINILNAISQFRPDVIDVSSGAETNGVKDITKIAVLIKKIGGNNDL